MEYLRTSLKRARAIVVDGLAEDLDVTAGRWYTVCTRHGTAISHLTRNLARQWVKTPDDWCEKCADAR